MRPMLLRLLCAVLASSIGKASAGVDRNYRVVARQNESTPSAGANASYGIIGSEPVIGAAGHVAFAGFVNNGDGNFAVWSGLPGAIEKLAITNDPAPGRPLDALDIFGVGQIRINPDGSTAFRAGLVGSDDSGVWMGTPGSVAEVAIASNPVAGLEAGTLYENFPGLSYVSNGAGEVAIRATVSSGGETVLLSGTPGEFGVLARQGDALPDQPAGRYGSLTFTDLSMNAHGQVIANVPLDTGDLSNDSALISGTPGDFTIRLQEGDPIEGIPGAVFDAFVKPRIANDRGIVFVNTPRGIEVGRTLFFSHPTSGLHALATEGEPAPGAPGSNYAGLFFPNPVVSSNGWAAFRAGLDPGANFDRDGIWVARHGDVELVAKKGDPAVGLPAGSTFTQFSHPVINQQGVLVFTADTTGGAGIWLWHRGVVRQVLAGGDRIPTPGANQTMGVVRDFSLKTGTGTQDGKGSSLNDACQLVLGAGFQIQIGGAIVLVPSLCDLDGDGVDCFLEDAFGTDCNDPSDATDATPQVRLDGGTVQITFRRLQGDSGFDYEVEASSDLVQWHPVAQPVALSPDQDDTPPGVERVQVNVPIAGDSARLLRVRVTRSAQ